MMISFNSDNRGSILVAISAVVAIATMLGSTLYLTMTSAYTAVKQREDNEAAYYIARSGMEYAIHIIEQKDPDDQTTWPNGSEFNGFGGHVNISIIADDDNYDIISTGTVSGKSKTIRATTNASGEVSEFQG
jgi:DhnA family fructose-bisphosphate aldolase class Ia